jgi:hypothetical protein
LHVVGLESLDRKLALCVEAELLAGGGGATQAAYTVLDELVGLAPGVAGCIVLERPGAVLSPLLRSTRENSPHGFGAWLRALAALARGLGVRLDLGTMGARYHACTARLVEELSELEGSHVPRLYLEGTELEALLEERPDLQTAVERLLGDARLVPCWSGPEGAFAGPGCVRRPQERGILACPGAIALNLPRIARRVGPFREELFHSALAELVQVAVEIAGALRAAAAGAREGLRARAACALAPVGLREALLVLGDGALDCALAARTLGFLGEAARRFARDGRLEPLASPFFGAEAAARFAFLDARAARAADTRQEWLFHEAEGESSAAGELRPYTAGFALSPVNGLPPGRAEAEALCTVPCGALELSPLAARDPTLERPALGAWRRFEVVRRARSGELVLELFPRPRPEHPAPHLRPLA